MVRKLLLYLKVSLFSVTTTLQIRLIYSATPIFNYHNKQLWTTLSTFSLFSSPHWDKLGFRIVSMQCSFLSIPDSQSTLIDHCVEVFHLLKLILLFYFCLMRMFITSNQLSNQRGQHQHYRQEDNNGD